MLASLPMYDLPEVARATSAWWRGLVRAFRAEGIADVPDRLTLATSLYDHWPRADLLFSQTCGYPLTHGIAGRVRLVTTPAYAAPGCSGATYRSLLIVAGDSTAMGLADLHGARLAYNGRDSQSGCNVLRAMVAPLAETGAFFGSVRETGSHRASIAAVGAGLADLCAVDCVTHALLQMHAPTALAGTRVLMRSPAAPGLPYVTAGAASDDLVDALRAGIDRALADVTLAAARDDLLIAGAEVLPLSAYDAIPVMEQDARNAGYATLA